jgi:hypothetical protein
MSFYVSPAPIGPAVDKNGNLTPAWDVYLQQTVFHQITTPSYSGPVAILNTQVLTSPQSVGTSLPAYTLTGTYATDLASLQALYDKVIALETALKTHGMLKT